MNSWKLQYKAAAAIALGGIVMAWMAFTRPYAFTNSEYLGGVLLLEGLAAVMWNYRQRFFPALILVFLFAGTHVPMQAVWGDARWLVLGAGALAGIAIYIRDIAGASSHRFQWIAFCCVGTAALSAEVSSFPKQPLLKAVSLLLLFLYGSFGARLAILHKEERFVKGLLWGCEALIYFVAFQYFLLRREFFGNPNSLGAVMAVAAAPLMLWGMFISADSLTRRRRAFALLLCLALLLTSYSRAGIIAATGSCILLCGLLRQYRMLIKGISLALIIATVVATVVPPPNSGASQTLKSRFLFKGREEGGVLGSRRSVWGNTISNIEQHPWLGIGFGTALTNIGDEEQGREFSSNAITTKEHGDSYLALVEGVGLVGASPFIALLSLTMWNIGRVLNRLWRSRDPFSVAVPIALVLVAGLIHAMFEDWLFAVGYYLCVFFWSLAFMLLDFIPPASPEFETSESRTAALGNHDLISAMSR